MMQWLARRLVNWSSSPARLVLRADSPTVVPGASGLGCAQSSEVNSLTTRALRMY